MNMGIYIINLAAYTAGRDVGKWIYLPVEEDELREEINEILQAWNDGFSPSEEWAILDYELPFKIDVYDNPFKINEYVERIAKLKIKPEIVKPIVDHFGDIEQVLEILEGNVYIFHHAESMADVAEEYYSEVCDLEVLPSEVRNNINWGSVGEAMESAGTFIKVENGIVEVLD